MPGGSGSPRIVEKHQCAVRIIGSAEGVPEAWGLDPHLVEQTGPQPLGLYHRALTSIDVALVPLAPSPFNTAKSDLKAREFLSVGVPVIASPTPANRELAKGTTLLLADTPSQWYAHLDAILSTNPQGVGEFSRRQMEPEYLDHHGEAWAQAWERAAVRRRKLVA